MSPIRVLIVDDHPTYRHTIRRGLEEYTADIQIVGEASDGEEAIDLVDHLCPDVVLMDIRMRGLDGIAATQRIVQQHPTCRVIFLTSHSEHDLVIAGIQAGAAGYVLKEYSSEELVRAITVAYHQEMLLSPPVARTVVHQLVDNQARSSAQVDLSRHEIEILRGIAQGEGYDEIGKRLMLSEGTIGQYLKRTIEKLGAHNRVHAVAIAKDLRII